VVDFGTRAYLQRCSAGLKLLRESPPRVIINIRDCSDGDGEVSEEEFIRIMKKTSLY